MDRDRVLDHLAALVAVDSRNPPRDITGDGALVAALRARIPDGFEVRVDDHGEGRVSVFAVRGRPRLLFNCHVDTVPAAAGWTRDPLTLAVEGDRAYGLGACDIKGAAAVLLHLAETTSSPLALLFTSDEEGSMGCCVDRFVASDGRRFDHVVVCEPTGCRPVTRHRGYLSVRGTFVGIAGHSSEPRALTDNAVHRLGRWLGEALQVADLHAVSGHPSCFNIGTVAGGSKTNVIAEEASVAWSARLAPGADPDAFLAEMLGLADANRACRWEVPFRGPPLPIAGHDDAAAREFAARHDLGEPIEVDFWTEASLFAAAGIPALVFGPGHIEQAHAADEWVAIDQLERAFAAYRGVCGD